MPPIEVLLQIVTVVALVAGIIFGILEVRRASKGRSEKAALDVFDITVQREVMDAFTLILELTPDSEPKVVRASSDRRQAAALLMNLFEYWGVMVFYRVVPLRTLDLLVGGVVRGSWRRLHNYIQWERETTGIAARAEWFQWLVERLDQYPQPEKHLGAHIAFADWKP